MKTKLAVLLAVFLVLSACATGSWQDFQQVYGCTWTGNEILTSDVRYMHTTIGDNGYGPAPVASVPVMAVKRVRQYQCTNGMIWR